MNRNVFVYLVFLTLGFSSCETEAELYPTNLDEDRVASQIDFSNSDVKRLYTDFNMGILFEYNQILDFAYAASSDSEAAQWGSVEIPQVSTLFDNDETGIVPSENQDDYQTYKNAVVDLLDDNLFKYFKPNTAIAQLMPYKVLVSHSIFTSRNVPGEASNVIIETESRFSSEATNELRTVYNDHSIVFSVNLDDISDVEKFAKDNFYILLCRIIGMHNLYDQIPNEFYGVKSNYYGLEIEPVYRDEEGIDEEKLVFVIDKDWFYEKGFIDSKYFFDSEIGTIYQYYDEDGNYLGVIGRITHLKAIAPDDEFVNSKEKDVRAYLTEMIHRDADEILAYPQVVRDNMKILLDVLTDWGIDILSLNPDLEVLN
ncbi:hypothetical protein WJN01_00420 [Flavobacteriaceae bacterium SZ-1-7]|uniref:hypothetical protein n=1 Tax=Tamlana sedimenti TaxID=3134126 RepID=UPI003123EF17